jgi:hypothetical protein
LDRWLLFASRAGAVALTGERTVMQEAQFYGFRIADHLSTEQLMRSIDRIVDLSGKIMRSVHEGAREMARDIATSDAYLVSRRQRKKVEMPFADLNLDRLRLCCPKAAKDEFQFAAAARNLRKLAKISSMPGLATA